MRGRVAALSEWTLRLEGGRVGDARRSTAAVARAHAPIHRDSNPLATGADKIDGWRISGGLLDAPPLARGEAACREVVGHIEETKKSSPQTQRPIPPHHKQPISLTPPLPPLA